MKKTLGIAIGILLLLIGASGATQAAWRSGATIDAITLRYVPAEAGQDARKAPEPPTPSTSETPPPTLDTTTNSSREPSNGTTPGSSPEGMPGPTPSGGDINEGADNTGQTTQPAPISTETATPPAGESAAPAIDADETRDAAPATAPSEDVERQSAVPPSGD